MPKEKTAVSQRCFVKSFRSSCYYTASKIYTTRSLGQNIYAHVCMQTHTHARTRSWLTCISSYSLRLL